MFDSVSCDWLRREGCVGWTYECHRPNMKTSDWICRGGFLVNSLMVSSQFKKRNLPDTPQSTVELIVHRREWWCLERIVDSHKLMIPVLLGLSFLNPFSTRPLTLGAFVLITVTDKFTHTLAHSKLHIHTHTRTHTVL